MRGGSRAASRPEPLLHAVDEEQEPEEDEAEAAASRQSSRRGRTREHARSHGPLLQGKEWHRAPACFCASEEPVSLLL